jgi:hypothetical protein
MQRAVDELETLEKTGCFASNSSWIFLVKYQITSITILVCINEITW